MKAFVITIKDNEQSMQVAERCIKSAAKHGLEVEHHWATTPKDNPHLILHKKGIQPAFFHEKYSRPENCMAAFLSHHSLWEKSVKIKDTVVIFEHDAIVTGPIPTESFDGCMTFSKPSYGKFNTPIKLGVDGLVQKKYFGGAHGYAVSPEGARALVDKAIAHAMPTDVYLNTQYFPWLQEYYPWICLAADHFTTIQKTNGCMAKHNFSRGDYDIINAEIT